MSLLERRRSPRFPFHSLGHVIIGKDEHLGTVLDLSAKGALFATGGEVAPVVGEFCALSVAIGSWPDALAIGGTVVNQRGQMLGIEFRDVAGMARLGLEKIVEMNLGHPQLLDRDVPALLRQAHGHASAVVEPA